MQLWQIYALFLMSSNAKKHTQKASYVCIHKKSILYKVYLSIDPSIYLCTDTHEYIHINAVHEYVVIYIHIRDVLAS